MHIVFTFTKDVRQGGKDSPKLYGDVWDADLQFVYAINRCKIWMFYRPPVMYDNDICFLVPIASVRVVSYMYHGCQCTIVFYSLKSEYNLGDKILSGLTSLATKL